MGRKIVRRNAQTKRITVPNITWEEAFYATAVLLLGGYGDLFGSVKFPYTLPSSESMPYWLRLFSLALTLTGQAFIDVLYALVTDALSSSRVRFFKHQFALTYSLQIW